MSEDCKIKIALLAQEVEGLTTKLQALDAARKDSDSLVRKVILDINSLIRKLLLGVSISFLTVLAYLAKGVLDKSG